QTSAVVDPGMTQAQVVERLGQPMSQRSFGSFTYLLYQNGCEKTCGMNDLVVLDSGKVVDAIFRSPARKYTGASSSPQMIPAAAARRGPDAPLNLPAEAAAKPASEPKAVKPKKAAPAKVAPAKTAHPKAPP